MFVSCLPCLLHNYYEQNFFCDPDEFSHLTLVTMCQVTIVSLTLADSFKINKKAVF